MLADELAAALGTAIILFAVAFFTISGYAGTVGIGHMISMVIDMIS
jgi:hypothetical protein